jgi:L-asparaginase / beta-aspartyl-peptidase
MKVLALYFAILLSYPLNAQSEKMENPVVLVIHGGAGTILRENMTPEKELAYLASLQEALDKGYAILEKGGSAIDAVEGTVMVLEDNPLFNAGRGSVLTHDSKVEMDAAIMDGHTLKAGSVAQVTNLKNPITAARMVMEKSPHVMMVGKGAEKFATQFGCKTEKSSYFIIPERKLQLKKAIDQERVELDHNDQDKNNLKNINPDSKFGTVGAVALDKNGHIAAATSTGGMTNKKHGRVGDAPIIGGGTYANDSTCAVSCTGHGEFFIRNVVAYDVSVLMAYKSMSLNDAAHHVVMEKLEKQDGRGGLIAVDRKGNYVMVFNTAGMYRGVKSSKGENQVLIYK